MGKNEGFEAVTVRGEVNPSPQRTYRPIPRIKSGVMIEGSAINRSTLPSPAFLHGRAAGFDFFGGDGGVGGA
jgi:hypothetical protein